MGTEKRDRQKANRAAKIEAEQAAAARAKRMETIRNLAILLAVVIIGVILSQTVFK